MMKKITIFILLVISLSFSAFSTTQSITQCLSSVTDNTEYLLEENFNFNTQNCFDLSGATNVTINGQGHSYDLSGSTFYSSVSNSNDITIRNFETNNGNFHIRLTNTNVGLDVNDLYLTQTIDLGTRDMVALFFTISGSTDDIVVNNVKFKNLASVSEFGGNNAQAIFSMQSGSQKTDLGDVTISNSEFLNMKVIYNDFNNQNLDSLVVFDSIITHRVENPIIRNTLFTNACSSYTFNNVMIAEFDLTDSDMDGLSDNSHTLDINGCTLFSGNQITYSDGKSSFSEDETYFNSPLFFVPSNTLGNDFILTKSLTLDGADIINLEGSQNSMLDLSLGISGEILSLTNVRAIRMGTGNTIYGGSNENVKPQVNAAGTISTTLTSSNEIFSVNWHLIEYDNDFTIDNIDFNLNAVGNYGLVRKRESSIDGINFELKNSIIDQNYNPNSDQLPFFVFGSFAKIMNNDFQLSSNQNLPIFQGGLSNAVSGGHLIQDNTFQGGGEIFSKLSDTIIEANKFDSYIIHNEFLQQGTGLYAIPIDTTLGSTDNLLLNPNFNGTYFFETTCTNYQFNVGNYHEFWFDNGNYTDANSDGIVDNSFVLGEDVLGNTILDQRALNSYPFDFLSNIGNAQATFDTCQSFNFNILQPLEQNYSSGDTLVSDWEFISIAYQDMICFETLNGFTSIYENVDSGDNKGQEYDTTDGKGFFQVKCCDTEQCNNIVQESDIIEFNIGDGTLGNLIVNGATTPTVVLGCTDNTATNYNPSATQDDGSCTYDNGGGDNGGEDNNGDDSGSSGSGSSIGLFSDSTTDTTDGVIGLLSLGNSFLGPLILIAFVAIFLGGIFLIRAMIGGWF